MCSSVWTMMRLMTIVLPFFLLFAASKSTHGWTASPERISRMSQCRHPFHRHRRSIDFSHCHCPLRRSTRCSSLSSSSSTQAGPPESQPFSYNAEVVGAETPMGAFWLVHHRREDPECSKTHRPQGKATAALSPPFPSCAAAVPEGISPGYLSPPGCPIYIPGTSFRKIWDRVPPARKDDCVFVVRQVEPGNSPIPPHFLPELQGATVVIPNFEVEASDHPEAPGQELPSVPILRFTSADASAPPHTNETTTLLYGKHAETAARILQEHDVPTEIVDWKHILEVFQDPGFGDQIDKETRESDLSLAPPHDERLDLDSINLVAWGKPRKDNATTPPQTISIVGGGILGTCMGLFLAQRCPRATIRVLDDQMDVKTASSKSRVVGKTTPASWAWINANSKAPKSYQMLNQLGIHAWKHEAHLASLPDWMGSLVRFPQPPDFVREGGYPAHGPLSQEDIASLEPLANWKLNDGETTHPNDSDNVEDKEGFTFYFPDEGSVDPSQAVVALREAAEDLGVLFYSGRNVTGVVRDPDTQRISGLFWRPSGAPEDSPLEFLDTELVVSTAGTGAAAVCLGGIPLLHRPGQIAYARPNGDSTSNEKRLSKILVDPLRSSHLLQRKDGTLVAGGGALEVGGSSGTVQASSSSTEKSSSSSESALLEGARQLSPTVLRSATLTHISGAVRPMPSDGLPVVGYVDQGLYVVVTHSGITLGPILTALAAGEIAQQMDCEVLAPYRPSRFGSRTTPS